MDSNHGRGPTVALLNHNADVLEALKNVLEDEGYSVVTGLMSDLRTGRTTLEEFVRAHDPGVLVFDIAPPFHSDLAYFEQAQHDRALEGRCLILTTTSREAVEEQITLRPDVHVHEVIKKPFDIEAVIDTVHRYWLRAREKAC